jgi:hypothetical protein
MSEGPVAQRRRMFKDGRKNVDDEERSVRHDVCSEWRSCSTC